MDFSQIYFSREARIGDSFSREMREMKNTVFVWNVYYFLWGEECSSPPAAYNAIHVMLILAVITYIVHQNKKNLFRGYLWRPWRYKNRSHIKSNGRSSQSQCIIMISRFSQPISREKREIKALRECEKNSRPHQV